VKGAACYRVLPEIEAVGPGREVWVHEVDDIAGVAQQVFEVQLPFTRPAGTAPAADPGE
jgi:hypothetical protein